MMSAVAEHKSAEHFWSWEERIEAEVREVSALVERGIKS